MLKYLLETMRPKQWYKNLVIFAGLVFSGNLLHLNLLLITTISFLLFCLVSGAVYIINDIVDVDNDKKHPKKKKRPIASGKLDRKRAGIYAFLILLLSLFFSYSFVNFAFFLVCIIYFILITAYSFFLKKIAFVDINIVGIGFVLRAYAGTVAIDVPISSWLVLTIFTLALFFAIMKRTSEFKSLKKKSKKHRKVYDIYDQKTLDFLNSTTSSLVILCYSLYTILGNHGNMFMVTIPFVIYGIFRAYHLSLKGIESAELFFEDKPFLINLFLWTLISIAILYFEPVVII